VSGRGERTGERVEKMALEKRARPAQKKEVRDLERGSTSTAGQEYLGEEI